MSLPRVCLESASILPFHDLESLTSQSKALKLPKCLKDARNVLVYYVDSGHSKLRVVRCDVKDRRHDASGRV